MKKETDELNWQQACVELGGCSKSHFYNLVNSGELRAVRNGRVKGVRVLRGDCIRYRERWRERVDGGEAGAEAM